MRGEERRRPRAGQEQPRGLSDEAHSGPGQTFQECRRSPAACLGPLRQLSTCTVDDIATLVSRGLFRRELMLVADVSAQEG